jgi:galactokinase
VAEHAMAAGVRGARLTGAGWGGCAIAVGAEDALAAGRRAWPTSSRRGSATAPRPWLTRAAAARAFDVRDA